MLKLEKLSKILSILLMCLCLCACTKKPKMRVNSQLGAVDRNDSRYTSDYNACESDIFAHKPSFLLPSNTSALGAVLGVGKVQNRRVIVTNLGEAMMGMRSEKRLMSSIGMASIRRSRGEYPYPAKKLWEASKSKMDVCLKRKGWTEGFN